MTTFAVTNSDDLLPAVNYLLSNLDINSGNANVTLPGNVLVANTSTGVISQSGNAAVFGYLYQYVNLRYSNNATGTAGFDINSNNYSYFGVFNSATSAASANPSAYQWYEVSPPFDSATSRTLYYSAIGGRQIQWAAGTTAPSSNYVITTANVAIDLDVVTTAAGTPGERGPIAMAYVITTADPTKPPATDLQLTGWFSSSRNAITPPIGTGLTPVVGDTAYFTYPTTGTSVTYEYTGSGWNVVNGQVVAGNVLVANTVSGTALAPSTITGDKITAATITGNLVAANTISGTNIVTETITATNIAASTITGNKIAVDTITGNLIAANTVTATNIQTNTITSNQIAANTITGNNIAVGTITTNNFTANTINGNIITGGSITADKLAANAIIANTVISTGATIGNFASPGFWLQGSTGNARFGNTVSIGDNLTVGNNALIGGNLSVTGLVTGGNLNANTVQTSTIVPSSVSGFASTIRSPSTFYSYTGFSPTVQYFMTISLTATAGQTAYIWSGVVPYRVTLSAPGVGNTWFVNFVTFTLQQNGVTLVTWVVDQTNINNQPTWVNPGYAVAMPVGTNTYRIGAQVTLGGGGNTPTVSLYSNFASLLGQALKR